MAKMTEKNAVKLMFTEMAMFGEGIQIFDSIASLGEIFFTCKKKDALEIVEYCNTCAFMKHCKLVKIGENKDECIYSISGLNFMGYNI